MKKRLFHPVLYLQSGNPLEMLDVSCNKCQPFCQCCRRDKHIQMINRFALFLKQPSDFSILPQATRNRTLLKHLSNYCHIIKMFFFSRIIGSIKKLCNGYLRDFTFVSVHFAQMLDNRGILLDKRNAHACVKQILSGCLHGYQLSTSLINSAPCRSSSAISIGSFSPPQSTWNLLKASSSQAVSLSAVCASLLVVGIINRSANHCRSL